MWEKQGLAASPGSPLEGFDGILISDYESTFVLHCGKYHQECLQRILRIPIEIARHESSLTWPKLMMEWIKKAIHYWNQVLREEISPSSEIVDKLLKKYHEAIKKATEEYVPSVPLAIGSILCIKMI